MTKCFGLLLLLGVFSACHQTTRVAAADPRDAEIAALKARITDLEAQKPKHQYSVVYPSGGRPLRFDSVTGTSCVLFPPGTEITNQAKRASCSCADELEAMAMNQAPSKDNEELMKLECGLAK